uniref:uncharacterized protein LOC122610254 n=1 Tax=Erigeron canadensis TaxID=72917 RepID=UPI001CB89956|nr:uncharacterized protein LOC122610254 [Erigeron canadensis]
MARTISSAGTSGGHGRGRGENEDSGQGRGIGQGTGQSRGRGIGRGTGPEVVQGVGRGAGRGNEQAGGRGTGRGVGSGAGCGGGRGSGRGRGRGEAENETANEQAGMQPDPTMIAMITQVRVKYVENSFTKDALSWWNTQCRIRGKLAAEAMSWYNFRELMMKKFCTATELVKLVPHLVEPENKGIEKYFRGLIPQVRSTMDAVHPLTLEEAILRSEAMTEELVQCGTITTVGTKRKETSGMTNQNCLTCYNCNKTGHLANYCREPRTQVAPLNQRRPIGVRGGCYECGATDHYRNTCSQWVGQQVQVAVHPNQLQITEPNQNRGNQAPAARGRAFVLNAAKARNDPNVVAGTFLLNGHYATVLFDSGADYSFVATSFIPLLSAKPSPMYLCFDVERANDGLVRLDQDVFPDELPGLPPSRQLDFRISLVPNAAPIAKSPYRLATTELQELATQLKELQDKGFIRPSQSPWGAPIHFLGHVVSKDGIHVDPSKIDSVKDWRTLEIPTEVRQFLGLASYYRKFIDNFSKIVLPLTQLTQKDRPYVWGEKQEATFVSPDYY